MREKGRVSWFDRDLRYGFIARETEEPDVFVHWTKIKKDGEKYLNTGDVVEFEVRDVIRKSKEKKPQAFDVEVIEEAVPPKSEGEE